MKPFFFAKYKQTYYIDFENRFCGRLQYNNLNILIEKLQTHDFFLVYESLTYALLDPSILIFLKLHIK
jgi:hypothetical protein